MTIPSIEQAPREAINQFQEEQLQRLMVYLQTHSAYYQRMFRAHGIDAEGVRTLAALVRLPFTTKEQLQQENADFRCVKASHTADYVTNTGTSGDPVVRALTGSELGRLADNEALA